MKNTLKSIGAVIAGVLVIVILSIATDAILESTGIFLAPGHGTLTDNYLAIALFYRTVYAFVGGFITAKLAPFNPKKHVVILLIIGTIFGIVGVFAGWNLSAHWYPISLVLTSAVAVWFGGKLGFKKTK